MVVIITAAVSLLILGVECWMGVVVTGWQGEEPYLVRSKEPGPYWLTMALHLVIGIGIPVLAFFAGV